MKKAKFAREVVLGWLAGVGAFSGCGGASDSDLFGQPQVGAAGGSSGRPSGGAPSGGAVSVAGALSSAGKGLGGVPASNEAGGEGGVLSSAGAGGATESGASGFDGAGMGGASAVDCPTECGLNSECREQGGISSCVCLSGFLQDRTQCRRPRSCDELHDSEPELASGMHVLRPAAATADFQAWCEMSAEGGGWTLILNEGPSFDPSTMGVRNALCYGATCTSIAYSQVLLGADVMLDVSDQPIAMNDFTARVIISQVHAMTRGRTVRALFTGGPYYLEEEDNSNLTVRLNDGASCSSVFPADMAALVCTSCEAGASCNAPVLVFGDDDPGCVTDDPFVFAIGGATSHSVAWGNCAGWPQVPSIGTNEYYFTNFRVWIR